MSQYTSGTRGYYLIAIDYRIAHKIPEAVDYANPWDFMGWRRSAKNYWFRLKSSYLRL